MLEIARVFSRIGCIGFGGPIAIFGLIQKECVERLGWIKRERFLELLATCKMLPGPNATMLAIGVGRERGGTIGGLIAGLCLILPPFLLVVVLTWIYQSQGRPPLMGHILDALQVGALVVIVSSCVSLFRSQDLGVRSIPWILVGLIGVAWAPRLEPALILSAGILGWLGSRMSTQSRPQEGATLLALFLVCLQAGSLVFGSGLAIIPLMETSVVADHGWLTHSQFMDGLAIGQITPGPVVITATFIGMMVHGFSGAIVATLGIFLSGFVWMLALLPRIESKIRGSQSFKAFNATAVPTVMGALSGSVVLLCWKTSFGFSSHLLAQSLGLLALGVASFLQIRFRWSNLWTLLGTSAVYGCVSFLISQT